MRSMQLSRASIATLLVALLAVGVAVGSGLAPFGGRISATPTALASATPIAASPSAAPRLPAADLAGEDLARLPRFPDSVRTDFRVEEDDRFRLTVTEYVAIASVDSARRFYQGVIAEQGWQRADVDYADGEWTYVLVDGAVEALIEIEESDGLLEIDLQLSEPIPVPEPPASPPPSAPPPPPDDDDDDEEDDDDDDDGDDDEDGSDDDSDG